MKRGFTILELMVCIAILVIFAGITYPVASSAIQAGKETKARSNLVQLHRWALLYSLDYQDHFAPGTLRGWPGAGTTKPFDLLDTVCGRPELNDIVLFSIVWHVDWRTPESTAFTLNNYELYEESLVVISNHTCNAPGITSRSRFQSRRAFGVELNGRVRLQKRPGDWERQEWWH
ncbi:MAG: prepilin-type N-terminal cleavage/methylation domain-containing protein [Fimbriimonadaceae bacterium]|jgi:prepilin-type N-terminal cleavage/methylation domain-containing protein|nr:prepilin-type N-terminal cleavage/methylation domain-containing protein [Fimbriimonadaceae bacterium]